MRDAILALACGMVMSMASPARAQLQLAAPSELGEQVPAAATVPAPKPPVHGRRGHFVIGGTSHMTLAGGHFAHRSLGSVLPENKLEFAILPSIGFFVANYVSVGILGDIEVSRAPGTTAWSVAIGPEVRGYVPLSHRVGLLPGIALLYKRAGIDDALSLVFKVPAAIHLNDHLSLTVGPQVSQDVWRHRAALRITGYGLNVGLVGWL